MKKETKMIQQKQESVEIRLSLVSKACKECIDEGIGITSKEISLRTQIPLKSLERKPYRDEINNYKKNTTREETENKEILQNKAYISRLKDVINKLNKENHNLKTELYYNEKI
jgi:hypothetical protein